MTTDICTLAKADISVPVHDPLKAQCPPAALTDAHLVVVYAFGQVGQELLLFVLMLHLDAFVALLPNQHPEAIIRWFVANVPEAQGTQTGGHEIAHNLY